LTVFQCITLEGWSNIMYIHMGGFHPWFTVAFFCTVVIVGSFFMMNLLFAVMWGKFS
ncbi:unnamed protein product, partial [Discosporangium mesarthrocarpum]